MAETWVSRPELEMIIGREAADRLCRVHGGVPIYVPAQPNPQCRLGTMVDARALLALVREYGNMTIVVPNGRRLESRKPQILELLDAGCSHASIALKLGVTERYVRDVASQARPTTKQLRLF